MRKKSTRLLSAALAVCMTVTVLPMSAFASGVAEVSPQETAAAQSEETGDVTGDVAIDEEHFPDSNFRKFVKKYDRDMDGKLSQIELAKVTDLNCDKSYSGVTDDEKIKSLKGIEYFTSLKTLSCRRNLLTELDVSNNSELKSLDCGENQLSALDVSNHPALEDLSSYHNPLTALNVSNCPALKTLSCEGDRLLSELDVSSCSALEKLYCDACHLSVLVLGNHPNLIYLNCSENQLTSLNIGSNAIDQSCYDRFHTYSNSYDIVVADNRYRLSKLPGNFDASKVENPQGGNFDAKSNILTVDPGATEVTYTYNCGTYTTGESIKAKFTLNVTHHTHTYGWTYDETDHWKECTTANCPGLTVEQRAEAPHVYTDATDPYCDTCGYVRSMYSVITGENVTAELEDKVLNVPVAADTKVHLTATAPEGKRFTGWTVKVGGEEKEADTFLTADANDPTKATFTMPSENVEVTANFASNPTLNPTLRVGDHVTATIDDNDASVPSGSAVPVGETVHLTAIAPEGQHFTGWTVKVGGEEQKADTFLTTPDENDLTKVTFTMPDANVEVTATFADDSNPEEPVDPVGPSDTGNIQGAISAVVIGAAAGAIIYEAGTGIYRVINMPGIPMPSNRIELAELLWEHAGKPEPVSTALYSDIDEGDTDAQKAARWAVEQDLMKDDADNNKFHPAFPVSKLRTCLTWNAAKEKGLFDKTEE